MQASFLKQILRSKQTVFSFKELLLIFKTDDSKSVKAKLNYYVKKGDLYHIRRGLYAKDANYNRFELATKILIPSYISFETVLSSAGIIFQYYSQIFIVSYQTKDIECDGKMYSFRTIKPTILTNSLGIELREYYSIASVERAFLDTVYLFPEYHFDNLDPLDWNKVYEILPIYENEAMKERVYKYENAYKKNLSGCPLF